MEIARRCITSDSATNAEELVGALNVMVGVCVVVALLAEKFDPIVCNAMGRAVVQAAMGGPACAMESAEFAVSPALHALEVFGWTLTKEAAFPFLCELSTLCELSRL
mmetsp:Transcript_32413/g.61038  ORF Transcript_32413/g.61038 Transcript_32413/m.61038 type:complete len:107 (+) Transcript_32413:646-966(+)